MQLRGVEPPGDEEMRAAALWFERKVMGYRTPSRATRENFGQAVEEAATATRRSFSQ